MKVLITGAAGFIGMHVAKRWLEHGDEVAWRRHSGLNNTYCTYIAGSFFPV